MTEDTPTNPDPLIPALRRVHGEILDALPTARELASSDDPRVVHLARIVLGLQTAIDDNPTLFVSQYRVDHFWSHVERLPNPLGLTGLQAPHWLGDWGLRGGRMYCSWGGNGNATPARVAWELTHSAALGTRRVYRKCGELRCVQPEHHSIGYSDALKDPEVIARLAESTEGLRRTCTRCGHYLPAGRHRNKDCSHCRDERRRAANAYKRLHGGYGPPPQPYVPPTNGHVAEPDLRTRLNELFDDEPIVLEDDQQARIQQALDDIFS